MDPFAAAAYGCGGFFASYDRQIYLLLFLHSSPSAWWGRSPLGVPFARSKGTKTRLGRSPLRTSLGYEAVHASSLNSARDPCCGSCYCHHTRHPGQLALSVTATIPGTLGSWPYRQAVSTSGPTWASGVPAAGSLAAHRWEQRITRVRPWGIEAPSGREVGTVYRVSMPSM